MPEYLAPGVYVEETSFRSKSIEGVSTSTTGFVGPTRTGPVGGTPELITSFGDFERMYGGLDDLDFSPNYLAHAVRAYFNEGGSRLYVSRAFAAGATPGIAASPDISVAAANPNARARFVARFPGKAGNGIIGMKLLASPVTLRGLNNAPEGSVVRIGGLNVAESAALTTNLQGPFSLSDGGKLLLTVNGANVEITFRGQPALAEGGSAVDDPVPLDNTNNTLRVEINGFGQTITLPTADTDPGDLVDIINAQLRGGFAQLDAGVLGIGSDRRGSSATVKVFANPTLKFAADTTAANTANANNNVGDLGAVTVQEVNALLMQANINARIAVLPSSQVALSTTTTGPASVILVRTGAGSVESALGFAANATDSGADGSTVTYFVKGTSGYVDKNNATLPLAGLTPDSAPAGGAYILTLSIAAQDGDGSVMVFEEMGLDSRHPRWIGTVLAQTPTRQRDALENRFAFVDGGITPFDLLEDAFSVGDEIIVGLTGGNDGGEPFAVNYEDALAFLESIEDISIVAAPGYSAYGDAQSMQNALITHAEKRRAYRIAVLDAPPEQNLTGIREVRGKIDSKYAALYYPWVVVSNPLARPGRDDIPREITLPPSGFVAGIYARNDTERGVFKAPANEVVRSAIRFEVDVNFAQQEVLNPLGINCLRYLSGRGYRVWGARTASSDPEFKYVNVRRYLNYIEHSIDRGMQWAVFEPNGERLWANIRDTVEAYLYNEWVSGALLGSSPKEAFFVRCDRSTMTQNDLDNGRLICLIGIAIIKPAEFVIFRVGQKTADARS